MATKKIPLPQGMVYGTSTTAVFHPSTMWMLASSVKKVRGAFEIELLDSDVTVSEAYQTANVENAPDNATAFGSFASSAGVSYPSAFADISAYTEQKQLVRFGWLVKNTASGTRNWVRAGGFVEVSDT